jgi:hypothetical protein
MENQMIDPETVMNSHFLDDGDCHASPANPIAADAPSPTAIAFPIPEINSPRNQNKSSARPPHQERVRFTSPPLPFRRRPGEPPPADAVVRVAARRRPAGGHLHGRAAAEARSRKERGAVQRRRRGEAERVGGDGHRAKGSCGR